MDSAEHLTTRLWERADSGAEIMFHRAEDSWQPLTWAQLARTVREAAAGLVASGVDQGDRVALMSQTRLEWTVLDLAILAVGAVPVPIYDTDSAEQCAWIASDSGARMAIAGTAEHAARLEQARDRAPDLGGVRVIDDGALDQFAEQGDAAAEAEVDRRVAALRGDDLATIVYTSGTTGRPKGCPLTHANLLWTARQAEVALGEMLFEDDSSTLLFLPLAHVFTRLIQFGCLDAGVRLGYARSAGTLTEDVASFRPTFLLAVPRVFQKIYKNAGAKASGIRRPLFDFAANTATEYAGTSDPGPVTKAKRAVSDVLVYRQLRNALGGRVRYCLTGGAPLDVELAGFFDAARIPVLQGYGLTETSSVVSVNRPRAARLGSSGPPLPGVEVALGENDEVLVRGPNVFRGYWNNDAATAESLDHEGWLHTGDLGELDDDGYLTITGRAKELIVTASGKNVAPEPLEERMKRHRLVSQPLVIGDDRPFVAALVTLDRDELARFAREHGLSTEEPHRDERVHQEVEKAVDQANEAVSRAESIRKFVILDREFSQDRDELTSTMKPRRRDITERFADEIDSLYQQS